MTQPYAAERQFGQDLAEVPSTGRRINALFVLSSLGIGGAEKQVVSLVNGMDRGRYCLSLVGLKSGEALLSQVEPGSCEHGALSLGVNKRLDLRAVRRLAKHI